MSSKFVHSTFRARSFVLLATLMVLAGCSVDVGGAVEHLSDSVESHCGWFESEPSAPVATCSVLTAGEGGGLLPAGVDPCERVPAAELRLEPGEAHTEWRRFGRTVEVDEGPCQ